MSLTNITSLLAEKGLCRKAGMVEEKASCRLVYCESGVDGLTLLIAFSSHGEYSYSKMVPEQAIPAHMWHCSDVFYTPYGLYTFSKSVEELVERMKSKLSLLEAQAKLAAERLAAMEEGGF